MTSVAAGTPSTIEGNLQATCCTCLGKTIPPPPCCFVIESKFHFYGDCSQICLLVFLFCACELNSKTWNGMEPKEPSWGDQAGGTNSSCGTKLGGPSWGTRTALEKFKVRHWKWRDMRESSTKTSRSSVAPRHERELNQDIQKFVAPTFS